MKVIFCLKYFLPEQIAGTEVYVAALCEQLQIHGVETVVVKPGYNIKGRREYFYKNIRVVEYPESPNVSRSLIKGKIVTDGLPAFKQLLLDERPDVLHFHEVSGSNGITMFHFRVAKKLSIPIFTTLHLTGYVCKTGKFKFKGKSDCNGVIDSYKCAVCTLHNRGFRLGTAEVFASFGRMLLETNNSVSRFVDANFGILNYPAYINRHNSDLQEIFATSEKVFILSNWFIKILLANNIHPEKISYMPQALPSGFNTSIETKENRDGTLTRLVYVGRISKIKGLDVLLKALASLKSNGWTLDIYGKVTDEVFYQECKRISKSFENVYWKGVLEPESVVSVLKSYDALVFPSIIEEMAPLTVQEAFAANIPVIGSRINGVTDHIEDGVNGVVFDTGDIRALGKVLAEIISDKFIVGKLASNLKKPASFKEVASKTLVVYHSVFESRNIKVYDSSIGV